MKLTPSPVFDAQDRSSGDASIKRSGPQTNRLFQTSTMAALLDAVYDGDVTVGELLQHGNFGLGTFNGLDGEMIIDDSVVHQFRADGRAGTVCAQAQTPFACVTHFAPERTVAIEEPKTKAELEALVDGLVDNPNLFVALRFTGQFEAVETRTVFCQHHPYPPMLEVVANQPTHSLGAERGVMLGFRTPGYMQGVNVAGYHLHFLTEDHGKGGHVTGYRLDRGKLELAVISQLEIALPRTAEFAKANLAPDDIHAAIRIAEGE